VLLGLARRVGGLDKACLNGFRNDAGRRGVVLLVDAEPISQIRLRHAGSIFMSLAVS